MAAMNESVVNGLIDAAFIAKGATASNIVNWIDAHSWGDHAGAGYLTSYTETEPAFNASIAAGITSNDVDNWNTASGGGIGEAPIDGSPYTRQDAGWVVAAAPHAHPYASNVNEADWNTAFGWGDHSGLYSILAHAHAGVYEPVDATILRASAIGVSIAAQHSHPYASNANEADWNTAFGWGNHADGGYLTSQISHADVLVNADIGVSISAVHSHPYASNVNVANWDTAFGWGDHTGLYDAIGAAGAAVIAHESAYNHTDYAMAYSWGNHALAGYLTGYTEDDPIFTAWDKSTGISINEDQVSNLQAYLLSETDPIFLAAPAAVITLQNITDWNTAFGWGPGGGGGIGEAPEDSTPYARQDAGWVSVVGGGGVDATQCNALIGAALLALADYFTTSEITALALAGNATYDNKSDALMCNKLAAALNERGNALT